MLLSWKIDQIILYRSTGDEEGEVFPKLKLFPYFNIDVQPELVNNFDEEMQTKTVNSLKNEIWPETMDLWLQSTEGNYFNLRRIINAPTWADLNLMLQK